MKLAKRGAAGDLRLPIPARKIVVFPPVEDPTRPLIPCQVKVTG